MSNDDTVCAISTPKGSGAIAIVRISGTSVKSIIKKFLNRSKISERRIYTGFFKYNDNIIDKVNYVYFKGPRSYTGEDLLEIYCHGSISVQNKLLDILVSNGINIANPGEFTLRAILNNKMTLIEGEAINQLINNRSEKLITKLNEHINGGFSQKIENIREGLVEVKALVEAGIDFSDNDEISDELLLRSKNNLRNINIQIKKLINSFDIGKMLLDGYHIAIIGKPNVGKSSLLNIILRKERAIVTEYAGTTRDVLKEEVNIEGYDAFLYDTAGLHKTEDFIEKLGIEKVKELLKDADCVIFMFDLSTPLEKGELKLLRSLQRGKKDLFLFLNKKDIKRFDYSELENYALKYIYYGSVKKNIGIDKLFKGIALVLNEKMADQGIMLFSKRQKALLTKANRTLKEIEKCDIIKETEIAAFLLNDLMEFLDQLIGKSKKIDIKDYIFKNFCIGK